MSNEDVDPGLARAGLRLFCVRPGDVQRPAAVEAYSCLDDPSTTMLTSGNCARPISHRAIAVSVEKMHVQS